MARYENKNGESYLVEEWECAKCNKFVPRNHLKEGPIPKDEAFFHAKAVEIEKEIEKNKRRNS
jgi:hypothetical protein